MKQRDVERLLTDAGYQKLRTANSHHQLWAHPAGHHLTISPDFFRGHHRGPRWLRTLRRKRAPQTPRAG